MTLMLRIYTSRAWHLLLTWFLPASHCVYPESLVQRALNWQFVKRMVGWFFEVMLLKVTLLSPGGGEALLLDMVAYAGYTFTGMCVALLGRITLSYAYYLTVIWTCLCTVIFLVNTMKRTLFAKAKSYDSSVHHYLLLCIAFAQFPLRFWLSNTYGNWFFLK